jgi:hypothetical protein
MVPPPPPPNTSVPVFGAYKLLDQLHVQQASRAHSAGSPFRIHVGELLWVLLEIYNRYIVQGADHKVNLADSMRLTIKRAIIIIIIIIILTQAHDLDSHVGSWLPLPSTAVPSVSLQPRSILMRGGLADSLQLMPRDSPASPPNLGLPDHLSHTTPSGPFPAPHSYLPVRILGMPVPAVLCTAVHAALLPAMKEVMLLVKTNLISAFRVSKEGEQANDVLRAYVRVETFSATQRKAILRKLLQMMAREYEEEKGNHAVHVTMEDGVEQFMSLLHT